MLASMPDEDLPLEMQRDIAGLPTVGGRGHWSKRPVQRGLHASCEDKDQGGRA